MGSRRCEFCGCYLDPDERCDCVEAVSRLEKVFKKVKLVFRL